MVEKVDEFLYHKMKTVKYLEKMSSRKRVAKHLLFHCERTAYGV